ncbi:hypothetical protein ACFQ51_41085 [Streptomyces kaempferi]
MWYGAFYRVRRDDYEICFVPDAGMPLDEIDDVDMWVIFNNGQRWSGTIHTLDVVHRLMDRWQQTGECLGGRFFYTWDGLIVRDRGIPGMGSFLRLAEAAIKRDYLRIGLAFCGKAAAGGSGKLFPWRHALFGLAVDEMRRSIGIVQPL